jgi:hypothetical protein
LFSYLVDGSLYNQDAKRCVDVAANGSRLQLFDCHGGANQRWLTR